MTKVAQSILDVYREKFLNKRVKIIHEGNTYTGNLYFLGYNKLLPEWGLQATVDRFPIQHVQLKNISLYEDNFIKVKNKPCRLINKRYDSKI